MKRAHDDTPSSIHLECTDGTSTKFWSCEINGSSTTVSYGKVGTSGRQLLKEHGSSDAAQKHIAKLHQEKLRKGYSLTVKEAEEITCNPTKKSKATRSRKPEIIKVKARVEAIDPQVAASLSGPLITNAKNGNAEKVRQLLDQGADPNSIIDQPSKWMSMHFAAEKGHTAVGRVLLEYGATVNSRSTNAFKLAPLDVAVMHSHKEMAHLLIDNGASVNEPTPSSLRLTPLHRAAGTGRTEMVSLLIDNGASLTASDKVGETPLDHAVVKNEKESVKLLIELGASVHTSDNKKKWTPLLFAAERGHKKVARILLEHGAKVDARSNEVSKQLRLRQVAPLDVAVMSTETKMAQLLIDNGASVNEPTPSSPRLMPLHRAAVIGRTQMASLLIDNGASVTASDEAGLTALHHAAMERPFFCERSGMVQLLIDHGADVNATTKKGHTPLCLLIGIGAEETAKILVKHGATLTKKFLRQFDRNGETKLHGLASSYRDYSWCSWPYLAQALIDSEPTAVNAADLDGKTPLHLTRSTPLARVLINNGASLTATDYYGKSALSVMWRTSCAWDSCLLPCSIVAIRMPSMLWSGPPGIVHKRHKRVWNKFREEGLLGERVSSGGIRAQLAMLRTLCMSRIVV